MMRTLAFKLVMAEEDAVKVIDTMREYTKAFNICTKWGLITAVEQGR